MTNPAPQTANDLLFGGGGAPAVQWAHPETKQDYPVGTSYEGEVVKTSAVRQRDLVDKTKLAVWPDGAPKYVAIVTLQTDRRDPAIEGDDGLRSLWVSGKYLTDAVKGAVKRTGAKEIEEGAHLKVTLTGYGKAQQGFRPPRLFEAVYTRPTPEKVAELAARKAAAEAASQQAWNAGPQGDPSDPWGAAPADPWGSVPAPAFDPSGAPPIPRYDQGGVLPTGPQASAGQYEGATPAAQRLIQQMVANQNRQGGTQS